MQDHIKSLTEVCDQLAAVGEPIKQDDRVVYLPASLAYLNATVSW